MLPVEQRERRGDDRPRREAGEDSLLAREPPGDGDRARVADAQIAVDGDVAEQLELRHRIAAALDAVVRIGDGVAGERGRALRLDHVAPDRGPPGPERGGDPRVGAARTDEVAEGVDLPRGLGPQLGPRVALVGQPARSADELVGPERVPLPGEGPGPDFDQREILAGHLPRPRARRLGHQDHLGAERPHHAGALPAVALGHHGHERMATDRRRRWPARSRCSRWSARRRSGPAGGHPTRSPRRRSRGRSDPSSRSPGSGSRASRRSARRGRGSAARARRPACDR